MTAEMISLGAKLAYHAHTRPDHPAVTCGEVTASYDDLHRRSNRLAHGLEKLGVKQGDLVSVGLPNSVAFVEIAYAIWKLGATPQPLSFRLPRPELEAIVEVANSRLTIGPANEGADGFFTTLADVEAASEDESDLPDRTAPIAKAPTSGGSTGRPKLILSGAPGITSAQTPVSDGFGMGSDSVVLLPGPLYHNAPFLMMMTATAHGAHVVLLPRFDAEATLRAIERHRASWVLLVPTMMSRIWRLPADIREGCDRSSLKTVWHMAAPCPAWLKEAFIHWIAPAILMELYAGTEAIAMTVITGGEWLEHRGSVGRVAAGEMKIVDEALHEVALGEVGEIYMRTAPGAAPTYRYLGAQAKALPGGWQSLGDLGWFDLDGYLYLADRRTDMILVGGANVYPAEIEAALEEHPLVQSCAVIGLPDEDMGARIHAIVQRRGPVTEAELGDHLTGRLVSYKLPRSIEFVAEPLRDEAGKVRRSSLRDERLNVQALSSHP
jgi:bile acid-coenzyme A ligase